MRFGTVLFICALPFLLSAQSSIDLLTLSGFYGFPASYENPLNGKATESGTLINLKVPVVLNNKTTWYNDFTHTLYAVNHDIDPEPAGMITSLKLQAFILQTGIAFRHIETHD